MISIERFEWDEAPAGTTDCFRVQYGSLNGEKNHIVMLFGIIPISYLGNHAHLWAVVYPPISTRVLRAGLRAARAFFASQPCSGPVASRFVEFFGFRPVKEQDALMYYWREKW